MIQVTYRSFSLPKSGNTLTEYEDAFWPYWRQKSFCGRELRFAIADGVTESSFARLWAKMLVKLYCNAKTAMPDYNPETFATAVKKRGSAWSKRIFARPLDWAVLEKVQRGGAATLLGLTLASHYKQPSSGGTWQAFGVGDSCLFHIRNACLLQAFPLTTSAEFGNHPLLLSTVPAKNDYVWSNVAAYTTEGEWRAGDHFLLMTDALAHWFLKMTEENVQPQTIMPTWVDLQESFEEWINGLRQQKTLRNDDTTFIHIHIGEP